MTVFQAAQLETGQPTTPVHLDAQAALDFVMDSLGSSSPASVVRHTVNGNFIVLDLKVNGKPLTAAWYHPKEILDSSNFSRSAMGVKFASNTELAQYVGVA